MKKIVYKLNGVDCANCGVKIENKINRLNGVSFSEYTFMLEKLNVLFDENVVSEEIIEDSIVSVISGVSIVSKKELVVSDKDIMLTNKKDDKVKRIFFRRKR